jgi:hypothetical protein
MLHAALVEQFCIIEKMIVHVLCLNPSCTIILLENTILELLMATWTSRWPAKLLVTVSKYFS